MQELSDLEWEKRAKLILLSICSTENPTPYAPCFIRNEKMSKRIILFDFEYSFIESKYRDQFVKSLQGINETGFFVSLVDATREQYKTDGRYIHDWYVSMDDIDNYGLKTIFLENIAFSENGEWGILFSEEKHALLTCTSEFLTGLESRIPNLHAQVYDFIKTWKKYEVYYKMEYSWIQPLLLHIYGNKKGKELFEFYKTYSPDIS